MMMILNAALEEQRYNEYDLTLKFNKSYTLTFVVRTRATVRNLPV